MAIMLYCLLQLPTLLVHIPQVGVGLSQHWVLLDGQGTEMSRPARKDYAQTVTLQSWHSWFKLLCRNNSKAQDVKEQKISLRCIVKYDENPKYQDTLTWVSAPEHNFLFKCLLCKHAGSTAQNKLWWKYYEEDHHIQFDPVSCHGTFLLTNSFWGKQQKHTSLAFELWLNTKFNSITRL